MLPFLFVLSLVVGFVILKKYFELSSDSKIYKDFFPNVQNDIKQLKESNIPFTQVGGTINDASGINRTSIYGIVSVKTEKDIKDALHFAEQNNLKLSIAGSRHSMGGQAFAKDALVLDMRKFSSMSVDVDKKILTVESGAIWHDIQNFLNPHNLSVKAMQSFDLPTVGGTIAVNAHGMDHRVGSIAPTIKSLRIMFANGSIQSLNRENYEYLLSAIIGGYGLLGIILDVELSLMDNIVYIEEQKITKTKHFLDIYEDIKKDSQTHMFYARLSTASSSFLKEIIIYTYKVAQQQKEQKTLTSEKLTALNRLVFNMGRKSYIGREIKWWAEKYIQPYVQIYPASRNQIMHRSYAYLKNNIKNNSDVLQEYFLPKEKLILFVDSLGKILKENNVVTRNVEIRSVYKENTLLDFAQGDWFGVVLYLNFNINEIDKIKLFHSKLIDLSQALGGSFYLPYQLCATKEQVNRSYPNFGELLKLKEKYDPKDLITSEFYNQYKGG